MDDEGFPFLCRIFEHSTGTLSHNAPTMSSTVLTTTTLGWVSEKYHMVGSFGDLVNLVKIDKLKDLPI